MRINARLDEAHSKKLAYLQKVFHAGVSEVIKQALAAYYERVRGAPSNASAAFTTQVSSVAGRHRLICPRPIKTSNRRVRCAHADYASSSPELPWLHATAVAAHSCGYRPSRT